MDQTAFGRRMFQARKACRMTSRELAERIGLNAAYIRQIECGRRKPSMETLIACCNELDVTADFLLEGDIAPSHEAEAELQLLSEKLRLLPERDRKTIALLVEAMETVSQGKGSEMPV